MVSQFSVCSSVAEDMDLQGVTVFLEAKFFYNFMFFLLLVFLETPLM
jgi:hypothetical protein